MRMISTTTHSSRVQEGDGFGLLRQQLAVANTARSAPASPALAVLIRELEATAGLRARLGEIPYDRPQSPFRSLSADLSFALKRLGPRLSDLVGPHFEGTYDEAWKRSDDSAADAATWDRLLQAGSSAGEAMRTPEAVSAALRDAVDAAAKNDLALAIVALTPALDDLRGILELRSRGWEWAQGVISSHLTVREEIAGQPTGGRFPAETASEIVLRAIEDALSSPREETTRSVWFSVLAGPGAHGPLPAVVNGPIAISGTIALPDEDVAVWIRSVREEMTEAFAAVGEPVPEDVSTLGAPWSIGDVELYSGPELWAAAASPPSFLARVEISAVEADEAVRLAREALRAVFSVHDVHLAAGIRSDPWVWTSESKWQRPRWSARGQGVGELFAARTAAQATARYGADLGTPFNEEKLERLRSRALVRNDLVAGEVRLMRAWSELEGLKPRNRVLVEAGPRLWLETAWQDATAVLEEVTSRVDRFERWTEHLVSGTSPEQVAGVGEAARAALRAAPHPRDFLGCLDSCRSFVEMLHPDSLLAALFRVAETRFRDPSVMVRFNIDHASAYKRASRHRNLVTHGHRLPDAVVAPTVAFMARQLELAISAENARHRSAAWSWMGSLQSDPETGRASTLAELGTAVSDSRVKDSS